MDLQTIVARHYQDLPGFDLFTAYSAGIPIHRLSVSLLVQEASPVDPIDLFMLRGIKEGLTSPRVLSKFFGLEELDVDNALANMLHDRWIVASPPASDGDSVLTILDTGHRTLEEGLAYTQQVREAEVWVDALTSDVELKIPRRRLMRPRDLRDLELFPLQERYPKPRASADIDFNGLQAAVASAGSSVWAGTKVNLLLDVLGVTPRGIGYKRAEVLVFQGTETNDADFFVFDSGIRHPGWETALRRLEDEKGQVLPVEPIPEEQDVAQFKRELDWIASQSELESKVLHERTLEGAPGQVDTRSRLREELSRAEIAMEAMRSRDARQRLVRNHENRQIWLEVLSGDAARYVAMEFPWITREAFDDEIILQMQGALRRGVNLWLSWGLADRERPDPGDPRVIERLKEMSRRRDPGRLTVKYRGNTHRKVLLWDGEYVLVGSFNFGSFRGDPRKPVRHEIGGIFSTPSVVADLEAEFKDFFGVDTLSNTSAE